MSTPMPPPGPPSAIAAPVRGGGRHRVAGFLLGAVGLYGVATVLTLVSRYEMPWLVPVSGLITPLAIVGAGLATATGGRIGMGLGLVACGPIILPNLGRIIGPPGSTWSDYGSMLGSHQIEAALTAAVGITIAVLILTSGRERERHEDSRPRPWSP